jgi:uncharacterized membrane protein YdcZ (DUF606 family)
MESAPLLFLLLLSVRLVLQLDEDNARAELRVGLVFALVCLARLDATFTAVPLAVVAARRGAPPLVVSARRAVRLLAPLAVALVGYIAVNLVLFDTATPVSGQAKSLGGPFFDLRAVEQFLKAGQIGQRPLWIGALTLALLALAFVLGAWRRERGGRRLMGCAAAFLVGQALMVSYLVVASSYPVWAWYHYNVALLAFCGGTLVALAFVHRPATGRIATGACLAVAAVFAVGQMPVTLLSHTNNAPSAVTTARWIDRELPPGAVLAMGDRAGLLGYLANRPMLHLEGLVADAQWLHDLSTGTALDRMDREGVDTYVWAGAPPQPTTLPDGRMCWRFEEPRNSDGPGFPVRVCYVDLLFAAGSGNDLFTVWRYRPELNPGG